MAIANGKLTYQRYKKIFSGPRWEALANRGAQTQRVLWASTSTKNPAYRDVYYVEELIGPDTVDTIPPATYDAFRDHGQAAASLEEDVDDAARDDGDSGARRNFDEGGDRSAHRRGREAVREMRLTSCSQLSGKRAAKDGLAPPMNESHLPIARGSVEGRESHARRLEDRTTKSSACGRATRRYGRTRMKANGWAGCRSWKIKSRNADQFQQN